MLCIHCSGTSVSLGGCKNFIVCSFTENSFDSYNRWKELDAVLTVEKPLLQLHSLFSVCPNTLIFAKMWLNTLNSHATSCYSIGVMALHWLCWFSWPCCFVWKESDCWSDVPDSLTVKPCKYKGNLEQWHFPGEPLRALVELLLSELLLQLLVCKLDRVGCEDWDRRSKLSWNVAKKSCELGGATGLRTAVYLDIV